MNKLELVNTNGDFDTLQKVEDCLSLLNGSSLHYDRRTLHGLLVVTGYVVKLGPYYLEILEGDRRLGIILGVGPDWE